MTRVAVGLGSNVGDRRANIQGAIDRLNEIADLAGLSQMYETAPIGGPEQDDFLNAVALVDTDATPRRLLDHLLRIEAELGRERRERWDPRTIDLDIILFGDLIVDEPGLTVPHPELGNRRFVIDPLLEVWPDAVLPDGTTVASLRPHVSHQEVQAAGPLKRSRSAFAVFVTVAAAALALWWLLDAVL